MSTGYGPRIINDSLVLYLDPGTTKSYPGSGGTWYDLAGNNNLSLGVSTAMPSFTTNNGGHFVFDGINDVANANTSVVNRTNGQELTVSCWIKPARTSGQYSVFCTNRANDTVSFNWIFYQHTTIGAISFHGSSQYNSSYVPEVDVWINATNTVIFSEPTSKLISDTVDFVLFATGSRSSRYNATNSERLNPPENPIKSKVLFFNLLKSDILSLFIA